MEKQDMRVLTLDPYQHGVVINALNELRNDLIEDKRPTDIVDEVLIKTIDAPSSSRTALTLFARKRAKLDRSVAPPLPTKSGDFAGTPLTKKGKCKDER